MSNPQLDPDDGLARELEEARAGIAEAEAEHEALRVRLGPAAPAPTRLRLPAHGEREPAAAYRGEDRGLRLEREVGEANEALANLRIENAILRSRAEPMQVARAAPIRGVAIALGLGVGGGFLWFLTANLGLLVFAAVMALVGWGATVLIDRIKPDGSNPRTPPTLPPTGGL